MLECVNHVFGGQEQAGLRSKMGLKALEEPLRAIQTS